MASDPFGANTAIGSLLQLKDATSEFESVFGEVEERQQQSLAAKKKLADETKAFKKLPDEDRLANAPGLLKTYQGEIDSLSKRAKFAEAAFDALFRRLREAPDVAAVRSQVAALAAAPAKAAASKAAASLEEQLREKDARNAKLKEEIADLESELSTVTNQAATVRRLEKHIKELEAGSQELAEETRKRKEDEAARRMQELRQEHALQMSQHEDSIAQLCRERQQREEEIDRLRQGRLQEHKFAEETAVGRSLEVESLSNEVEKLQGELERERCERLQRAEAKETQGSVKVLQSLLEGAQRRAAGLEREATELRQQLSEAEVGTTRRCGTMEAEKASLEADIAAKSAEIVQVRDELASRPSAAEVAELKQQLQNIDTVEHGDVARAATDLERRLLQKQKVLETALGESTQLADQRAEETEELRRKMYSAEDGAKDLRQLVERLEKELGQTTQVSTVASEAFASLLPAPPTLDPEAHKSPGPPTVAPSLSAVAPADATCSPTVGLSGSPSAAAAGTPMPSMLEIISGQRERLRERAGDLEQERDRWRSAAEQEKKRADTLNSDNVQLLERVRFMSSFQTSAAGASRGRPKATGLDPDLENRYGAAYEDRLEATANPLEQFRDDERGRRLASMSAVDRTLVIVGSMMTSSKVTRNIALGYLSLLHMLVFFALMKLAHGHNHSLT